MPTHTPKTTSRHTAVRGWRFIAVSLVAAVMAVSALAGAYGDSYGETDRAADDALVVSTYDHAEWGTILVDADNMVLYMFTRDEPGVSNCAGGCAEAWPPLTADAGQTLKADDQFQEELDLIERDDGQMQVTYAGMPLYYFAGDANPGDTEGQGAGDVWYVLSPSGDIIRTAADVADAEAASVEVTISGFAYQPAEITVEVGTTVAWTNEDSVPHTVTSTGTPDPLDSPLLNQGNSWEYTFDEPGQYDYFCTLHPNMQASVVVNE